MLSWERFVRDLHIFLSHTLLYFPTHGGCKLHLYAFVKKSLTVINFNFQNVICYKKNNYKLKHLEVVAVVDIYIFNFKFSSLLKYTVAFDIMLMMSVKLKNCN